MLQYVEQFLKDPVKVSAIVVTKKREDICNLLEELTIESGPDVKMLSGIVLPNVNGKLIERQEPNRDHETSEDLFIHIKDSEMTDGNIMNASPISEENGSCKGGDC